MQLRGKENPCGVYWQMTLTYVIVFAKRGAPTVSAPIGSQPSPGTSITSEPFWGYA